LAKKWYLYQKGKRYGPYDEKRVHSFIHEGRVKRNDLVWCKDLGGWRSIAEVEPFKSYFAKPPARLPSKEPAVPVKPRDATQKKLIFTATIIGAAIAIGLGYYLMTGGNQEGQPQTDVMPPNVSSITVAGTTEDSATITWYTDEPSDSEVNYGKESTLESKETSPSLVTNHSVTITGLEPGTEYRFRVYSTDAAGNTSGLGIIRHFMTEPHVENTVTVDNVIDGDSMWVWTDSERVIIRLACADTEETSLNQHAINRHPELQGMTEAEYEDTEYWVKAIAAKDYVSQLLPRGTQIGLDIDDENPEDVYGRPIVVVWVQVNGTWTNLNRELIRLEYAEIFQDIFPQYQTPTEFDPWSW